MMSYRVMVPLPKPVLLNSGISKQPGTCSSRICSIKIVASLLYSRILENENMIFDYVACFSHNRYDTVLLTQVFVPYCTTWVSEKGRTGPNLTIHKILFFRSEERGSYFATPTKEKSTLLLLALLCKPEKGSTQLKLKTSSPLALSLLLHYAL